METLPMTPNDVSVALYRPQPGTKSNAIAVRRAMLSMPAVMESLDTIEKAVFVATTDKPFEEYSDNELVIAFSGSLKWIAKDIGLRDTESQDFKASIVRISQITKRYYPTLTIKDIKMAFELTVTGELNDYYPKDRNGNPDKDHYQNFNAEYFCKVVNAYRAKRASVIRKANEQIEKPVLIEEKQPEKWREETQKELIQTIDDFARTGQINVPLDASVDLMYRELVKLGFAEPVEITANDQNYCYRQLMADLIKNSESYKMAELQKRGTDAEEIQRPAYYRCVRRQFKDAIENIILNEVNIKDYING